ncbi:DNA gyrase inhibitor YacG [Roseicyclus sp. F158]|uniref:DNA gyrase inhibitor YacG n=1 Tax=Tropicimonas omnivorans TaxID=3075590 RepID=A0ABU3DED7_9RHOB|nr:DNA gyrase inhibitor YacG [Roseicyclus sp. F158]MDT0682075.1 DNA gyrase inhibitor YacG [Roseicyclus sp. F158]
MTCPICSKPTHPDYRPFCSRRCADVDLGKWLHEAYRVPVTPTDDEDGAPDPGEGDEA